MRIIAGDLKRRTLRLPSGLDVRPTTDRVREAAFNFLASRLDFEGLRVLDCFAGSGALGFEALSRGAERVTFVERDSRTVHAIRANAETFGVSDSVRFVRADAYTWLGRYPEASFDLIFADPPYDDNGVSELPELALRCLASEGILVLEHERHVTFDDHPACFAQRAYGRSRLAYFEHPSSDDPPQL